MTKHGQPSGYFRGSVFGTDLRGNLNLIPALALGELDMTHSPTALGISGISISRRLKNSRSWEDPVFLPSFIDFNSLVSRRSHFSLI